MEKTKIKNLSNFALTISLPAVRYRRDLNPGQEATIPEDALEEFNFDAGCRNLVQDGFLKVISSDPLQEETIKVSEKTSDDVDIVDLLKNQPVSKLSAVLKTATPALKDAIAQKAIELAIADGPHCNIIKAYTGVDVITAIQLQHDK